MSSQVPFGKLNLFYFIPPVPTMSQKPTRQNHFHPSQGKGAERLAEFDTIRMNKILPNQVGQKTFLSAFQKIFNVINIRDRICLGTKQRRVQLKS